jgi:glycerol uptake facilitator-like aquaporin
MYGEAGRNIAKLGMTAPVGINIFQLIVIEAVATFILVICVVPFATDDRASKAASGTTVGFALTAAILFAGPLTGGAINPARALGPMIVLWDFSFALGYVAGPIIGAVAAAFAYDKFFAKAEKPDSAE